MWIPSELGEVIAERRIMFRRAGHRSKPVTVRFGKPVRAGRGEPWWAPFQVRGLGSSQVRPIAGEDSLQALVLALECVNSWLPAEAKRAGGRIDWLGEKERPVFAGSLLLEIQWQAAANLKKGIRSAVSALQTDSLPAARRRALLKRLERLLETSGVRGYPALTNRRKR